VNTVLSFTISGIFSIFESLAQVKAVFSVKDKIMLSFIKKQPANMNAKNSELTKSINYLSKFIIPTGIYPVFRFLYGII